MGKYKVRVTAIGDAADAKELQHLAEGLSNAYQDFLEKGGVLSSTQLVEIKPGKTGWRLQSRFPQ